MPVESRRGSSEVKKTGQRGRTVGSSGDGRHDDFESNPDRARLSVRILSEMSRALASSIRFRLFTRPLMHSQVRHQFTADERSRGGRNALILHPDLKSTRAKGLPHDSETQRRRRLRQIANEEIIANELRKKGWMVLSPLVVCDRIGVKDNNVYFVEFKKPGQKLRPRQALIRDLVPEMYRVIYRESPKNPREHSLPSS